MDTTFPGSNITSGTKRHVLKVSAKVRLTPQGNSFLAIVEHLCVFAPGTWEAGHLE